MEEVEEAEEVRQELVAIQQEHLITLEDAVVLEHGDDGHVHLRQAINMTAAGAMGGTFWGLLIGLIFVKVSRSIVELMNRLLMKVLIYGA